MAVVSYPAVFYKDSDSDGYTVAFHDLSLYTEGKNVEEAFLRAKEFLVAYIKYSQKYEEELPEPSDFEKVKSESDNLVFLIDAEIK